MIKKLVCKLLDFEDEPPQAQKMPKKMGGMKPLYLCKEGDCAKVALVLAGKKASKRLGELGLVPGAKIIVASKPKLGPMKIAVKGTCLALGENVASNIFVRK